MTSTLYTIPQIGSLANADAICMQHARAAGLAGTYAAWLSTATVNARSRVGSANGWVRVDGKPVAGSLADLVAGRIAYPVLLDEGGALYTQPAREVFTATGTDGTYSTYPQGLSTDCAGYTSTSAQQTITAGFADGGGAAFSGSGFGFCSDTAGIYCLGIDQQQGYAIVPASGRRAFVTRAQLAGNGGRAAFDTACQQEATAAGLPGSYLALVALTTEAPSARFDRAGAPWVRLDGVPLAATARALFSQAHPDATIDHYADGTVAPALGVAIGVPPGASLDHVGQDTCNDWSQATTSVSADDGGNEQLLSLPTSGSLICAGTHGVGANRWSAICLQQ